jgi:hypothetical protein
MRPNLTEFALAVASLAAVACSSTGTTGDVPEPASAAAPPVQQAQQEEARAPGRAIATVVTQDKKLTVVGTGGDLRFVVRNADGTIVADGIDINQLQATAPALHAIVLGSLAQRRHGTYVDAIWAGP